MGIGALMRRAVFLDRDGVLNQTYIRDGISHPPQHLAELVILPGVAEGLALLTRHGFLLIGVTNQPDVARGAQTQAMVEQINTVLVQHLPLDAMYVCYHDTADQCACRKPKPGMLLQAAQEWQIDLAQSMMVGDRWSDIEAGQRAGCTTYLINQPYSQAERCTPYHVVTDLYTAAQHICLSNALLSAE
jgi:D-glycero-D-manno-heptose 1,7-bisphosphate phosphatase